MSSEIRTFEELQDYIWEERHSAADCLLERLEELNEFERGRWKGEIDGYDNIIQVLRGILKHGEDLNEMERLERLD